MDSREFYDYIMEKFNLNGSTARLVNNIIGYVNDVGFVDAEDAQAHLKSLLDGAFGIEEQDIKLYRALECGECGDCAPYGLKDSDGRCFVATTKLIETYLDADYMCCLHDEPRTFEWCEENCPKYYSCDTVAWAGDDVKIRCGEDE